MEQTFYIVQYNDFGGDGKDVYNECVVKNKTDFKKWLREHNKQRKAEGNEPEKDFEFDLIPVTLFTPNK